MFTGVCLSTGPRGVPGRGGGVPAPGGGGVPGGDTPQTATAVGGTHPTGMHSCLMEIRVRPLLQCKECSFHF